MSNQENLKKKRGCHENFLSKSEREEKGTWPENGYQRRWSDKNSLSIAIQPIISSALVGWQKE
jgi:hypothetical protein